MLYTDPHRRHYREEPRYYRNHDSERFRLFRLQIEESDLQIGISSADFQPDIESFCRDALQRLRSDLEAVIREESDFLANLSPAPFPKIIHPVARKMIHAAESADVGPMAAVAGAVSEYIGEQITKYFNPDELFIENGGDIYLKCSQPIVIGIGAGESPLSYKLGLLIEPQDTPLGICTSSGKVGPSLSFGQTDAATVIAASATVADAFATALGNKVAAEDDIEDALAYMKSQPEILTALVIIDEKVGIVGHHQLSILQK